MRSKPIRSARFVRTHYFIAALIPAIIVTLSISGFVWAQSEVTVVVDGQTSHVKTQAADVAGLLKQAEITWRESDVVSPAPETPVAGGMTVVVRHAVPVSLDLGGSRIYLDVIGTTVADALVAAGVDPSANPSVTPSLTSKLVPHMSVRAPQVFSRVTRTSVTLPFSRRTTKDPALPQGVRKVVSKGRPGLVVRVYRSLVSSGVEGPRALAAESTLAPPVDEVVAVGTARRSVGNAAIVASARSLAFARVLSSPPRSGRKMRVEATGYAPFTDGSDDHCATGAIARRGVIAVDPRVIPLGTHVYVPGYGYAVAADTGGAIKGDRIDLCFDTGDEAVQWGRRHITIVILD